MALWGNNDNVGAAGSVSLNYATKVVTAPAGTGVLGGQFGESGQVQEGDVISFGLNTKAGTFFGSAVVASIASTTSLTIGSTAGLSGAAIAATTATAAPPALCWNQIVSLSLLISKNLDNRNGKTTSGIVSGTHSFCAWRHR